MKQIIIEPSSRANLNNISKLEEIIYLGCSANQEILITTRSYLSNSQKSPGSAISAKSKNKKEKLYNLYLEIDYNLVLFNTIKERFNISYFQLLNNNEILLTSPRSWYKSFGNSEKNGRIYSDRGEHKREILLGDGIADVQVSESGIIWTSYFDEGIFGNRGWSDPIGKNGLVAWDSSGKKLYEFYHNAEIGQISDCYALNVISDREVWLYYYTEFPLVKLKNYKIEDYWFVPIKGSSAFAIYRNFALFNGGYRDYENFYLVKLEKNHQAKIICQIKLMNISEILYIFAKRDTLYFLSNREIFQLSVFEAMTNLNG
ncbi:conserved hypothetical protein [Hyella patelloides LEGE 07179]|uniref:Uncharacterized protein n=1 Tax=Hyella patelloides LEGE 07179 TaxID=945734 RepID=A0A563VNJ8_9CYAN|nr:hypothetical protein [Hyella patelloides]VEP12855.1 conserved hypothetical protein [Hyella patelloides LEGE 07179]